MLQAIETLKKGELFLRKEVVGEIKMHQVFEYEGYCKSNKKYTGTRYSDHCDQMYFKKGTMVVTGFEF